jgi:hypothetical protein
MIISLKQVITTSVFCLIFQLIYAQDLVKTTGTAQQELTNDKSRLEIENKVREYATINALEKAFGSVIIQGNATYISNEQSGDKVHTNTVFNTIANTSVKGEVVRVLDEKFTDVEGYKILEGQKVKILDVRCDIVIMAREIITPPVDFVSFPLASTDEKSKATAFKNNEDFYLYFSSPVSGYLTVYLDDNTESHCLYPYSTMSAEFEGGVPVKADEEYVLFSTKPEFNYFPDMGIRVDAYKLYTNKSQEMNRLFIIFSRTPLNKPQLSPVRDIEDKYKLPKYLPSEAFQKWLNKYRSMEKANVQVEIVDIVIRK